MIDLDTRDDRLVPGELSTVAMVYPTSANQNDRAPCDAAGGGDLPAGGEREGRAETTPKVRTELAASLHFILSQYLRPSTLRRLIGPRDAMIGRVMLGRSMQGEIDDDLLARILAQAVVEHIRQSGFVVQHRGAAQAEAEPVDDSIWF
jgi:hypothetical protein